MWAWVLNSAGDIEDRRRSRARRPHCKATTWRYLFKCFNALPAIFSLPAQFRAVAGNLLRLRFAYSEFGLAVTDAPRACTHKPTSKCWLGCTAQRPMGGKADKARTYQYVR